MNQNLKSILIKNKTYGDALLKEIENVSSSEALDRLIEDFKIWDDQNKHLLNKGFVTDYQQFYNIYNNVLSNVFNIDKTFESNRKDILDRLPRKLTHLQTTINSLDNIPNTKLLPLENDSILNPSTKNNMKKVFISHASADNTIVMPLVDLLQSIGLSDSQIFYSSHPAFGVKPGENILERIKSELNSTDLVLFILSDNFYKSPVCLCEMGAAWIKTSRHIPILIPPFSHKDIKGAIPSSTLALNIDNISDINSLKHEIDTEFGIKAMNPNLWDTKRDKYFKEIKTLIPA